MLPGGAAVVGAVKARAVFDIVADDVHAQTLCVHGHGYRDTALKRRNLDLTPGLAFVGGLVDLGRLGFGTIGASTGAATTARARASGALRGSQHDIGIVKRGLQIARAVVVLGLQDVGPGLAAIGGTVNSAAVMTGIPEGGDNHQVVICGIDNNAVDLHRVLEADVLPCCAGIGRLPHPIAQAAPDGVAGSGINDIGIGRSDLDGADAIHAGLLIHDWQPGHAAAGGFPDAAQWRAGIKHAGIADDAGHRRDASAVERPNVPPFEAAIKAGIDLRCRSYARYH